MSLLQLFLIHLAAVASPGPDNLLVLTYSKGKFKNSLLLALGLSTGILIHTLMVVFGVGAFVVKSPNLFMALQIFGGLYLGYIAYQCLSAKPANTEIDDSKSSQHLYRKALITFLLNPKALLYFFSILPQFIDPNASSVDLFLVCAVIVACSFFWFFGLGIVIGFSKKIVEIQDHPYYLKTVGTLFLLLAGKVILGAI